MYEYAWDFGKGVCAYAGACMYVCLCVCGGGVCMSVSIRVFPSFCAYKCMYVCECTCMCACVHV